MVLIWSACYRPGLSLREKAVWAGFGLQWELLENGDMNPVRIRLPQLGYIREEGQNLKERVHFRICRQKLSFQTPQDVYCMCVLNRSAVMLTFRLE